MPLFHVNAGHGTCAGWAGTHHINNRPPRTPGVTPKRRGVPIFRASATGLQRRSVRHPGERACRPRPKPARVQSFSTSRPPTRTRWPCGVSGSIPRPSSRRVCRAATATTQLSASRRFAHYKSTDSTAVAAPPRTAAGTLRPRLTRPRDSTPKRAPARSGPFTPPAPAAPRRPRAARRRERAARRGRSPGRGRDRARDRPPPRPAAARAVAAAHRGPRRRAG